MGLVDVLQVCSLTQRMPCAFCILIIYSALSFCTGTGKIPLTLFHHKPLQPPRFLRERRCPSREPRQCWLPGRGREEGAQRRADCRKGQSRPACQITVETRTMSSSCDRKVGWLRRVAKRLLQLISQKVKIAKHYPNLLLKFKTRLCMYAQRSLNKLMCLPVLKPTALSSLKTGPMLCILGAKFAPGFGLAD